MKTRGNIFVNARKVPVAEEFGDVRQLIAEAREIDAQLAKFTEDVHAPADWARSQIAIGALKRIVQNAIVRLQLGELQVRKLHHVKRFVEILVLVQYQRGVPVDHHQVMFIVTQVS